MLITFIVTTVVLAALYLLIIVCNKVVRRPSYDFSTSSNKTVLIIMHALFGLSVLVIAAEIGVYFAPVDRVVLWIFFGIFVFFAIISLITIYGLCFTYEAIRGDEVFVRRYFKTKKFSVNDIARIREAGKYMIGFYDKNGKCLFIADSTTNDINELIRLINERRAPIDVSVNQAYEKRKALLEQIGREYRAGYKDRRKKTIIGFCVGGAAFVAALATAVYFLGAGVPLTVFIAVAGVFAVVINLFGSLNGMKKELVVSDERLGEKRKYANKNVVGASKATFKTACITCVCLMFMGAVFNIALFGAFAEITSYDEYAPVTGVVEYTREQGGKNAYVAVGFEGVETEYRLSSIALREFDYAFLDEVKAGDTVTLLVSKDTDREFSMSGVSKERWNYCYYVATDDKEYFAYDDYVKAEELNKNVALGTAIAGSVIAVVSAATLIGFTVVCKKREKNESIEVDI